MYVFKLLFMCVCAHVVSDLYLACGYSHVNTFTCKYTYKYSATICVNYVLYNLARYFEVARFVTYIYSRIQR